MRENKDKTAQICAMYWMPVSESEVEDYPGTPYIFISGYWTDIPISSAEFKEDQSANGKPAKQEMKCTVTGMNPDQDEQFQEMLFGPGLLRIDYTNGDVKVVGNTQFPVQLSIEKSGSPISTTLSFKRNSPELSKYFKSF